MTMHRKWTCWFFLIYAQKGHFWYNKSRLTILLSSLRLHLSSLLVRSVKDVACKSSHNNFYKNERAIWFVHVQCNLRVTCTLCCTLSIICNPLHHVYSNSWVLDVPHCLMKHVGASLRGRAWKKWFVSWAMIWSRHIEGFSRFITSHRCWKLCFVSLTRWEELYIKPLKENSIKLYYKSISLPWAPPFFYHTTSFASFTAKPVGPCQWIM